MFLVALCGWVSWAFPCAPGLTHCTITDSESEVVDGNEGFDIPETPILLSCLNHIELNFSRAVPAALVLDNIQCLSISKRDKSIYVTIRSKISPLSRHSGNFVSRNTPASFPGPTSRFIIMSSINEEEILRIIGDGKILHTLIRCYFDESYFFQPLRRAWKEGRKTNLARKPQWWRGSHESAGHHLGFTYTSVPGSLTCSTHGGSSLKTIWGHYSDLYDWISYHVPLALSFGIH